MKVHGHPGSRGAFFGLGTFAAVVALVVSGCATAVPPITPAAEDRVPEATWLVPGRTIALLNWTDESCDTRIVDLESSTNALSLTLEQKRPHENCGRDSWADFHAIKVPWTVDTTKSVNLTVQLGSVRYDFLMDKSYKVERDADQEDFTRYGRWMAGGAVLAASIQPTTCGEESYSVSVHDPDRVDVQLASAPQPWGVHMACSMAAGPSPTHYLMPNGVDTSARVTVTVLPADSVSEPQSFTVPPMNPTRISKSSEHAAEAAWLVPGRAIAVVTRENPRCRPEMTDSVYAPGRISISLAQPPVDVDCSEMVQQNLTVIPVYDQARSGQGLDLVLSGGGYSHRLTMPASEPREVGPADGWIYYGPNDETESARWVDSGRALAVRLYRSFCALPDATVRHDQRQDFTVTLTDPGHSETGSCDGPEVPIDILVPAPDGVDREHDSSLAIDIVGIDDRLHLTVPPLDTVLGIDAASTSLRQGEEVSVQIKDGRITAAGDTVVLPTIGG